jgi:S1-C subfamily serine protease
MKILHILAILLFTASFLAGMCLPVSAYPSRDQGQTIFMTAESSPAITDIIASVTPAVVFIWVEGDDGNYYSGSGMIIDQEGNILTNFHVIEDARKITVIVENKWEYVGVIQGVDEVKDLAVIKISGGDLPFITLGDSTSLKQGEEVIAIGYPDQDLISRVLGKSEDLISMLSGGATISKGIVSAFRTDGKVSYVQTDAAINHGNSGGPLINLQGEVIGINNFIIRMDNIQGINFAIAINDAKIEIQNLKNGVSMTGQESNSAGNGATGTGWIWFIVIVAAAAAVVFVIAKQRKKKVAPAYTAGPPAGVPAGGPRSVPPAVSQGARLLLNSGSHILLAQYNGFLGRPDFEREIPPHSLNSISRQHLQYKFENGRYYIADMNSSNGTKLNGVEIKGKGWYELKDGDRIELAGIQSLVFRKS